MLPRFLRKKMDTPKEVSIFCEITQQLRWR